MCVYFRVSKCYLLTLARGLPAEHVVDNGEADDRAEYRKHQQPEQMQVGSGDLSGRSRRRSVVVAVSLRPLRFVWAMGLSARLVHWKKKLLPVPRVSSTFSGVGIGYFLLATVGAITRLHIRKLAR